MPISDRRTVLAEQPQTVTSLGEVTAPLVTSEKLPVGRTAEEQHFVVSLVKGRMRFLWHISALVAADVCFLVVVVVVCSHIFFALFHNWIWENFDFVPVCEIRARRACTDFKLSSTLSRVMMF